MAVARKLAVIMFAMWRDGTEYRFGAQKDAPESLNPTEPTLAQYEGAAKEGVNDTQTKGSRASGKGIW